MEAAGLWARSGEPLFQAVGITRSRHKGIRKGRHNVLQMIRRHTGKSRLPPDRELS